MKRRKRSDPAALLCHLLATAFHRLEARGRANPRLGSKTGFGSGRVESGWPTGVKGSCLPEAGISSGN